MDHENPESEFLDDKLIYDIFQKAFTKMLQKFESIDKWINNVDLLNLGYGLRPYSWLQLLAPFLSTYKWTGTRQTLIKSEGKR